jgi:hypothetical protein
MTNIRYFGVLTGLVFGLVWVWLGVGAAFVVMSFALMGWLIAVAIWVAGRIGSGELDLDALRKLVSTVFSSDSDGDDDRRVRPR